MTDDRLPGKKKKKKRTWNENAAIRGAVRRIFSRSPVVWEVLSEGRREVPKYRKDGSRARKDAVQYLCQVCNQWVGSTKIAVDHIDPVIPADSTFLDWNTFIARLFCGKENLQRICDGCHYVKTQDERRRRREFLKSQLEEQQCEQQPPRKAPRSPT